MDLQVPVRSSNSTAALLTQNCIALAVCAHTHKTRRCTLHVSLAMFCSLTLLHPIVLWAFLPVVMIIGLSLVESQTLWGVVHTHCKAGTQHCKHINTQIEVLLQRDGGIIHHHKTYTHARAHSRFVKSSRHTWALPHIKHCKDQDVGCTKSFEPKKIRIAQINPAKIFVPSVWGLMCGLDLGTWDMGQEMKNFLFKRGFYFINECMTPHQRDPWIAALLCSALPSVWSGVGW